MLVASWTEGSVERMGGVMSDHGVTPIRKVADWPEALKLDASAFAIACLGIERGFEAPDFAILSEQDVLGDRMVRAATRARRAQNFIAEASSLTPGDLVTHIEHGVGRYLGLKAIDALGAPHDCLELQYDGGKLFLPVENIELLTRYGSDEGAQLDRLGGAGWQKRKAKMKERVRAIAAELIKIAAARQLKSLPPVEPPSGLYDEFSARFPYQETEDQDKAIAEAMADLAAGRPMDRLVCGDVGFGKTEVAMRAAFVAAMAGEQVAVVVPTTLAGAPALSQLCRALRRLSAQGAPAVALRGRQGSEGNQGGAGRRHGGYRDRHPCPAGRKHQLQAPGPGDRGRGAAFRRGAQGTAEKPQGRCPCPDPDRHADPAHPATGAVGVRDLSLITTPPIDRLAVRTFVTPFDPLVVREALLREHYRGGQSFFVAPRIADLREAEAFLKDGGAGGESPPSPMARWRPSCWKR